MWTTDPLLEKSFEVIKAWGFTFKTPGFVWAKTNAKSGTYFMGCGYYTRANPEYCLLATKGKPKRLSRGVPKLIVSPRREHSRKPDETYERIEKLFAGPYCELFARTTRPGWVSWGNETRKFGNGNN
jgi:N6-adenosine-specific RNA methylase IME4